MKKRFYIVLSLISILFIQTTVYANEPPDLVTIDSIIVKKAAVVLDHKKHSEEYKIKCKECHHSYKQQKDESIRCIECHTISEPKIIQGRKAPLIKTTIMKNIYHDKCINCHDKIQRTGKPFPKKCSVCHPIRMEEE